MSSSSKNFDTQQEPTFSASVKSTLTYFFGTSVRNWVLGCKEISPIITGLFLSSLPMEDTKPYIDFINGVNPSRPLGLVVSALEYNELHTIGGKNRFKGYNVLNETHWNAEGILHKRTQMVDFGIGLTLNDCMETVFAMRKCILNGESVLIHCKAGKSRSAMICAVYLSLFENDPKTGKKYTFVEAEKLLGRKREQVDIGRKHVTAKERIAEINQGWNEKKKEYQYNPALEKGNPRFDLVLGSDQFKQEIFKLPAMIELMAYMEKHGNSKRAEHIRDIEKLIKLQHSEEWFFKLLGMQGPFNALAMASPHLHEDDTVIREKLLKEVRAQIMDYAQKNIPNYPYGAYEHKASEEYFKNIIITSKEFKALEEYEQSLEDSARRGIHIKNIRNQIEEPNSSNWFYALLTKSGPFNDLIAASPHLSMNTDTDRTKRMKLVNDLRKMVLTQLKQESGIELNEIKISLEEEKEGLSQIWDRRNSKRSLSSSSSSSPPSSQGKTM